MMRTRRFTPDEWRLYRELRLGALAESPDAFGSVLEIEAARPDETWRQRLAAGATSARDLPLVALVDERPAGLCWARIDEADPEIIHVYQFWVVPAERGKGVGEQLGRACIEWARAVGARELVLGVTTVNEPAVGLYRKLGFVSTGALQALRPGSALQSETMRLDLARPRPGASDE